MDGRGKEDSKHHLQAPLKVAVLAEWLHSGHTLSLPSVRRGAKSCHVWRYGCVQHTEYLAQFCPFRGGLLQECQQVRASTALEASLPFCPRSFFAQASPS